MSQHLYKILRSSSQSLTLLSFCMIFSASIQGQSCDFTTGLVELNVNGGNQTDSYTNIFVLTAFDGAILQINEIEPSFEVLDQGFYSAYAINFRDGTTVTGVEVGMHIEQVVGDDCFDVGSPFGFTVCEAISPCNHCLGETITLSIDGGNNDTAFTTKFILTDKNGNIISIQDDPVFENLDPAVYLAIPVNYETGKTILGLEVGKNIANVQSGCLDIGEPYIIGICDQLTPNIFFDLRGCDITQTATLRIGETFDTYLWSTGSTNDFIDVSATVPGTYGVTVTLENGCIGVAEQQVTGNEVSRLGDFVWEDTDADGRQDPDENGMNGVTVNLFADFDNNGIPDFPNFPSCITSTQNHPTTGEPGWYEFTLYRSSYVVGFEFPTGFLPTDQNIGDEANDSDINAQGLTGRIVVDRGEVIDYVDAGFRTSANICGSVWEDLDGNGRRGQSEEGVDGVTLNLYSAAGEIMATTVSLTNPNTQEVGVYCFENIAVRDYYIEIVVPDGQTLAEPNVGADESIDSDATGENGFGTTDIISTSPGATINDITFGIYTGGMVCGIVWQENAQGLGTENVFDPGMDSLIANSQVELVDVDTERIILFASTDVNGSYCITGIPVGSYRVVFRASGLSTDYVQSNQGNDPLLDSDVDINTGTTPVFFVAPEEFIAGINAGLRLGALPIELTFFDGFWDAKSSSNVLEWQTVTEINNDHFEIERAFGNSDNFKTITSIAGNGTTSEIIDYTYSDVNIPRSGIYYYRLKQVDYDGGFDYSNIIAIDVLLNKKVALKVFPNPARDEAQLEVMIEKDDYAKLSITDMMGREVSSINTRMLYSGLNLIALPVKEIPNGTYLVTVEIGYYKEYELIHIAR